VAPEVQRKALAASFAPKRGVQKSDVLVTSLTLTGPHGKAKGGKRAHTSPERKAGGGGAPRRAVGSAGAMGEKQMTQEERITENYHVLEVSKGV
jgi:hypothetical protein